MSNQKKHERKWHINHINKDKLEIITNLIDLLRFFGSPIAFFCKFLFKFELPKIIFIVLLVLIFCYGFKFLIAIIRRVYNSIKDYFHESDCLYKESENDKEKKRDFYFEKIELRKKTVKCLRKYIIPRLIRIIIASLLIIFLCLVNPLNAKAFCKDMHDIIIIIIKQPSEDISESKTEQDTTDIEFDAENNNLTESTEDEKERKPPGYRFVLSYPDKIFSLDSQIEAQVYFYDDDASKPSIDLITLYLSNLKKNRKTGLVIKNKFDDEEDKFKSEIAKYMDIEYLDDWYEVAPTSDDLDEYIKKREEVSNITIEGKQGCYELWWKLANDYQFYALEYEMQTNNKTAVMYFYSMSVYCCMRALEYEMSDEMYNMIYHYMAMRYHDIYRDECMVSSTYKKRAEIIYFILEPDAEY